ncbi:putative formate dehydrogenase accessory protein, partial [Vibrio parahaemolyticus EKP-028]
ASRSASTGLFKKPKLPVRSGSD